MISLGIDNIWNNHHWLFIISSLCGIVMTIVVIRWLISVVETAHITDRSQSHWGLIFSRFHTNMAGSGILDINKIFCELLKVLAKLSV
jgi:hypothetical protein